MTTPPINEMDLGNLAPQGQDIFAQMGLKGAPPNQSLLAQLGLIPPPTATPNIAADPMAVLKQKQEEEERKRQEEAARRQALQQQADEMSDFLHKYARKTPEDMYREALDEWMPKTKGGKAAAYIGEMLKAGFGPPGKYVPVEDRLRKQSMEQYKAMEPILQRTGAVEAANERAEKLLQARQAAEAENRRLKTREQSFREWNEMQKRATDKGKLTATLDRLGLDQEKWALLGEDQKALVRSQIEKNQAQTESIKGFSTKSMSDAMKALGEDAGIDQIMDLARQIERLRPQQSQMSPNFAPHQAGVDPFTGQPIFLQQSKQGGQMVQVPIAGVTGDTPSHRIAKPREWDDIQAFMQTENKLHTMLTNVALNPDVLGLSNIAGAKLLAIANALPPAKQKAMQLDVDAVSNWLKAQSGVQYGMKEQAWLSSLFPTLLAANPKTYIHGTALLYSSVLAKRLLKQAGITPDELDLAPALEAYTKRVTNLIGKNPTAADIPGGRVLIAEAARLQKKRVVLDDKNRIIGVEPIK